MGQATNAAFEILPKDLGKSMTAALYVRDRSDNKLHQASATYSTLTGGAHVEQTLMVNLHEASNEFNKIPNNAVIIFAANWSPCKTCTGKLIPDFMSRINYKEKNIRVRFRFRKHYTRANYGAEPSPHSHDWSEYWESNIEADIEYRKLSETFGSYTEMSAAPTGQGPIGLPGLPGLPGLSGLPGLPGLPGIGSSTGKNRPYLKIESFSG